jgi:ADP-L-glycero-D-manno-heptose 6-epimerase
MSFGNHRCFVGAIIITEYGNTNCSAHKWGIIGASAMQNRTECRIFDPMIVVTGAAGFIGSAMLGHLQALGYGDLVAVDDFSNPAKNPNLEGKKLSHCVHRDDFFAWFEKHAERIQFVHHIGARTDTAEFGEDVLNHLNLEYSKRVWELCVKHSVPLNYASSAATYGAGENGFSDDPEKLQKLQPLNPYGLSKHKFDLWVMQQERTPPFWAGFKFFNVFGPNEYHKKRMASVVFHAYNQIKETGKVSLFRSHRPDFEDGKQLRDFVYVKDVLKVLVFFMENRRNSGLYNLGTGTARTFQDLVLPIFSAMNTRPVIEFIDIPTDIREKYQYHTCADMDRLLKAGYNQGFYTLEAAVNDYLSNYLTSGNYM